MPVDQGTPPEILTEAGKDSLIDFVVDSIATTFDDTVYQAVDFPSFVADDNFVGPFANVSRQTARLACRSYARGGGPTNLPGFDAIWGGICQPYLESIGEDPTVGSLAPPFLGGQCYTGYSFIYSFRNPNTGEIQDSSQTVSGRIIGLATRQNPQQGTVSGGINRQLNPGAGIDFIALGATFIGAPLDQSIRNVQRIDGLPDDCGNVPPLYDPPKKRPGLPPVPKTPIDFPGIGPIGVNIDFNPDGTINVKLPDVGVDIDVPVDFSDDGSDDGGEGGGGGGAPPGDVGEPGSPELTGEGGEAEGEAPEGSELVGLRVQLLNIPPTKNQYTPEVYRGVYYTYMGVPGLLDHDPAGAMAREDQFVFAEREGLTAWRVRANDKWSIRVTPYYREVE